MQMNQLALVKSDSVIERAVMRGYEAKLASVHRENPEAWLRGRLKALFPGDGEILELMLSAEEGVGEADDQILLDGIVDAYMNHVREAEQSQASRGASEWSPSRTSPATYLYDGKSFDEWRDLWKQELNPQRRSEAIAAFAAFARTGYGKEAAEAILDVAGQYDFSGFDQTPEGQLKQRVLDVLTRATSRVSERHWLPILMERLHADRDKWTPLAGMLLSQMHQNNPGGVKDADARKLLFELASDPQFKWWHEALHVLLLGGTDVPLTPETELLVKNALAGEDRDRAHHVLALLNFRRLEFIPEQVDFLFDKDEATRQASRLLLRNLNADVRGELAERLLAIVDDAGRSQDHADAVRALGVLQNIFSHHTHASGAEAQWERSDVSQQVGKRLSQLINEGPEELVPAALVAVGLDSANQVDNWLERAAQPKELQQRISRARDKIDAEAKTVFGEAEGDGRGGGFF
jgi:hypothetical protein